LLGPAGAVVGGVVGAIGGGLFGAVIGGAGGDILQALSTAWEKTKSATSTAWDRTSRAIGLASGWVAETGTEIARTTLDVAEKVWTLPNTVVGLTVGLATLPFGSRPEFANNALIFKNISWWRGRTITIGNVILSPESKPDQIAQTYAQRRATNRFNDLVDRGLYQQANEVMASEKSRFPDEGIDQVNLWKHEEAHTYQYQALGPLFVPAYVLSLPFSPIDPFESAADRYAKTAKGWWP
jgi:hypothetical protein